MRGSLKALLIFSLLAAGCVGTAAANAAPRSAAKAPIICPGEIQPCCGPPTTVRVCCQPPIPCGTSLTISVAPDPSKARQALRITGGLTTSTGSVGATVTLWQELPGQVTFHVVAQTKTDSSGNYSFTRRAGLVLTNRSWYVSAAGARSETVLQRVSAAITMTASATRSGSGEMVRFAGKVAPSHAGERIRLERSSGHGWAVIGTVSLSRASTFQLRERFAGVVRSDVRAMLAGDRRNVRSYSATVKALL